MANLLANKQALVKSSIEHSFDVENTFFTDEIVFKILNLFIKIRIKCIAIFALTATVIGLVLQWISNRND